MEKITFDKLSEEEQTLILKAKEASTHYYNPNGTHYVGCAILTDDGKISSGAAVRRASASSNTCAERMAIDQAIFSDKHEYKILATIGFKKDGRITDPVFPCGSCRQIIHEFYPEAPVGSILISNSDMSKIIRTDIHELLPAAYISLTPSK